MAEKKIGKYLIYAVGEIVLVVIGILIALSVSNANEVGKQNEQEQRYLKALKLEFEFNKDVLDGVILQNAQNVKAALAIIELVGPKAPLMTANELGPLITGAINNEVQYRPSPGVLSEIINAGKLGSFSDADLKKELASWEAELKKVQFQENEEVHRRRMALFDFLTDNMNIRRSTYLDLGKMIGYGDTQFDTKKTNILRMEEFENLMINFTIVSDILNRSYYLDISKKIKAITTLIDKNITNKLWSNSSAKSDWL